MPANNSDDENDSCVLVGTPLVDLLPEDAKFTVKPKRVEEQIVTDEKGRQRFHGAFTGGFSAGYFNTVGSKEGWAPSTFKSTRSERQNNASAQRPEDFMDEEDFAEHGIAPKRVKVRVDYESRAPVRSTAKPTNTTDLFLDDLLQPASSTIGVRMLRKMGWREGQGIGPKIKRKLRKLKTKLTNEPGRKMYGVALPSESDESADDEKFEDEYLVSTYDVNQFQFEIKEDQFGLGYKRLDVGSLFGGHSSSSTAVTESPAASLLFPMMNKKQKINKKGISGHAFGVGDFEDDEDIDVYKQDTMESYDFDLNDSRQKDTKKLLNKTYGFGQFDDDISIINKFVECKTKQMPSRVYPAPVVPSDFNLKHRLEKLSRFDDKFGQSNDQDNMNVYLKSITQRAEILGQEQIEPESVLDLVSAADREFLKSQREKRQAELDEQLAAKKAAEVRSKLESEKAKRYETYVSFIKKDYKDPYSFLDTSTLTEWEKQKEKEEFERRYGEYLRKLEQTKRETLSFVSLSSLNEQNQEVRKEVVVEPTTNIIESTQSARDQTSETSGELSELDQAVKDKKYGSLTRTEVVWVPHPTVCKRFNVKNPYPDAKEYGTVKSEADRQKSAAKFSLFNVLTAGTRFEKKKNLFDELNDDGELLKPGLVEVSKKPSNSETRVEESKIEFENKINEPATGTSSSSEYISILSEEPVSKKEVDKKDLADESIGIDVKNNVYLQERPSFDMFKAIFENEDDEDEPEDNQQPQEDQEDDDEKEEDNHQTNIVPKNHQTLGGSGISVIKSSVDDINVNLVRKLLDKNTAEVIVNKREDDTLKKVLKNLQIPIEKSKDTDSDDDDDESSSSSGSEELVYEEVSISNSDDKKNKSHKKKKHHKKHHKKKSKKKHKSSK